jgi:hypothetical protein
MGQRVRWGHRVLREALVEMAHRAKRDHRARLVQRDQRGYLESRGHRVHKVSRVLSAQPVQA